MVINTNTSALTRSRLLGEPTNLLSRSLARLSSASPRQPPDATGSTSPAGIDARINRTAAAQESVANAILFSRAQGAFLEKVSRAFDRMRQLALLAREGNKTAASRSLYNAEFFTLGAYVHEVAGKFFSGARLFSEESFPVRTDGDQGGFAVTGVNLGGAIYSAATGSNITTVANAVTALADLDAAIRQLAVDRAAVGANLSRLVLASERLSVVEGNLRAARPQIVDADRTDEGAQLARYDALAQGGTALLTEDNAASGFALGIFS